jgi:excisionase family DNA binding protein
MNDQWMTPEQVAKILNFSRSYIYTLLRSGELPSVRVGRVYRITPAGLNQFLLKHWHDDEPPIGLEHFNG